jgi:hypothetical protein
LVTYRKKEGPLMRHWDDVGKLQKGQFLPPPLSLSMSMTPLCLSLFTWLWPTPHQPLAHFLADCHLFLVGLAKFLLVWLISSKPFIRSFFIALMMEAVRTCETLIYFSETTQHYIPVVCYLQDIICLNSRFIVCNF